MGMRTNTRRDTTEMVQRFDVGTRLSEMAVHNGVCYLAGQVAADNLSLIHI